MRLLTTRAAANELGVHENTLRRWADKGIIRPAKLPGSGFRRYRPEDVHRLAGEMFGQLNRPSGTDAVPLETRVIRSDHDARAWEQ